MTTFQFYFLIYIYVYIYSFLLHPMACGILIPRVGLEPLPPAVETWSLSHWGQQGSPTAVF